MQALRSAVIYVNWGLPLRKREQNYQYTVKYGALGRGHASKEP